MPLLHRAKRALTTALIATACIAACVTAIVYAPTAAYAEHAESKTASKALVIAARAGNADLVRFSLAEGATPNATDPATGETALMLATRADSQPSIDALIAAGANLNLVDNVNGFSALMHACLASKRQTIYSLLEAGSDTNVSGLQRGLTALMLCASRRGGYATVADLIGAGARVNQRALDGWTAAMAAAERNRTRVLRLLLANRASVSAVTDDGRSALAVAVDRGYGESATRARWPDVRH